MLYSVIESGLIVRGMPYSETVRTFKRESAARAFAAKRLALKASFLVNAAPELRSALTVVVVAS